MKKKLIVIDDEVSILDAIKVILEDMEYLVDTFSDPQEGLKSALSGDYDLIITDLRMHGLDGAEITEKIMEEKPSAKILVITAFPNDQLAARALNAGAKGLLKKPFEIAKILDFLQEKSVGL